MRRGKEKVELLQRKLGRKVAEAEDGNVTISVQDAVDLVFLLDLVRTIMKKTEEVMQ